MYSTLCWLFVVVAWLLKLENYEMSPFFFFCDGWFLQVGFLAQGLCTGQMWAMFAVHFYTYLFQSLTLHHKINNIQQEISVLPIFIYIKKKSVLTFIKHKDMRCRTSFSILIHWSAGHSSFIDCHSFSVEYVWILFIEQEEEMGMY